MTSTSVEASAPGKLMLAGEYAVVGDYGPALSVALDVSLSVILRPAVEPLVTSEALGIANASITEIPVLERAFLSAGSPAAHVEIISDLGAGITKPGFGSSAALCVAALKGLRAFTGGAQPTLAEAIDVHRAAQEGRGSGYDVATSLLGGVCVYHNHAEGPVASTLDWCEGLMAAVLFTGRGTKTTRHLDRLTRAERLAQAPAERALRDVGCVASRLTDAWRVGEVGPVLRLLAEAEEAAIRLDEVAELGARGGGIAEASAMIREAGAIARMSGAGGGDCLWAFSDDPGKLECAVRAAEKEGFSHLDIGWPAPGAHYGVR